MTGREQNGKEQLRHGFTTGSCAAAASKAALQMLLGGRTIHSVRIMTPKGYAYQAGGNVYFDTSRLDDYYVFSSAIDILGAI